MAVLNVNKNNFQKEVMESEKTVLLDFWASWCGPCKAIAPVLEQVAEERPDVLVAKVNVDEEQELALEFKVMSIPTLVVLKNGQVTEQAIGARSKASILAML